MVVLVVLVVVVVVDVNDDMFDVSRWWWRSWSWSSLDALRWW